MTKAAWYQRAKAVGEQFRRADSWMNLLTGLGDPTRDKARGGAFQATSPLSDQLLASLFHEDPIAARVVELLPNHAFRQGLSPAGPPALDPDQRADEEATLASRLVDLEAVQRFTEAAIWGRLFGGGVVFVGADDGQADLSQPLDLERVRAVRFLKVLDKRDLYPDAFYTDPLGTRFGDVEVYALRSIRGGARSGGSSSLSYGTRIHETRMVVFGGALTSDRERLKLNHWDHSVLKRVYDSIRSDAGDWQAVSNMLTDASQGVLKIKEFWEVMGGEGADAFKERLKAVEMARFVGRLMPIDSEEDFTYQARSFAGIPDLLGRLMLRLTAAVDIPATVLWGQSPTGLSATGESDMRIWYDTIRAARTRTYEPRVNRVIRIIAAAEGLTDPAGWSSTWPSLWQMSPTEEGEQRKKLAETDAIYITSGVLDDDEVRAERFGGEFSDRPPMVELGAPLLPPAGAVDPEAVPPEAVDPEAVDPEAVDPQTALNGAQVAALLSIVQQVAAGQLPRESAVEIIVSAFPVDAATAEQIMGTVGRGFEPRQGASPSGHEDAWPSGLDRNTDMSAMEVLSRVGAPQLMLRKIVDRVIDGLGIGDEDLHRAIAAHNFRWTSDMVRVGGRTDSLASLGLPPAILDDLSHLEMLVRVRTPQPILRKLAIRVASGLFILDGDLEAAIASTDFAWTGADGAV